MRKNLDKLSQKRHAEEVKSASDASKNGEESKVLGESSNSSTIQQLAL
jgi:hypothetical protein